MIDTWRRLAPFLEGRRFLLGIHAALAVAGGVIEAALLVTIVGAGLAVAEGASQLSIPVIPISSVEVTEALLVAGLAALLLVAIHAALASIAAQLGAHTMGAVRRDLIQAFTDATWERQSRDRDGVLQDAITVLALQSADLALHMALLLGASLALFVLLLGAVLLDPIAAGVVLAAGAGLFAMLTPVRRATRSAGRTFVESHGHVAEEIGEWAGLALETRAFGAGDRHAQRLVELSDHTSAAFRRSRTMTRLGSSLLRDVAVLLLILAVAALDVIEGADLALVGAVVLLIVRSLSYAQAVQTSLQNINERTPSLDRLVEHLESLEHDRAEFGDQEVSSFQAVELDAVTYRYGERRPAIEDVSVRIAAGEALGIVGPSGSGKSTLVQILLRLRAPSEGLVRVDDRDYRQISQESWSRLVAIVPQEPRLFYGTIEENVVFGRTWITGERVRAAAEAASMLDEVESLESGFDTMLGPQGAGLSGGQRQRIAIARALAGDPRLLILDEPTSALDVLSEQRLQRSIASLRGRTTLVIVAHRLTSLEMCDRVAALRSGHLVAVGSLQEAVAAAGLGAEELFDGVAQADSRDL